jgi:DNA-binding response OmpR family regulator
MEIINYSEKRFLVVEDQRPFLVMLRGLLNTIGAQSVAVAANAETAVSLCRKEKFDFIVCDLHLGADKKNGFELVEELRTRKLIKPTTVMLVISADSAREYVIGSLEREPDDYLIKPFSQIQLKTRLSRAFHKRIELESVYSNIAKQDIRAAIEACLALLRGNLNYRQTCLKLLSELYLSNGDSDAAIRLTQGVLNGRAIKWAQINLAKAFALRGAYDEAQTLAAQLLKANRLNVDAYDILADCFMQRGNATIALDNIKKATNIAPLSLKRQFIAANIGRKNGDFDFAKDSCLSIWQMTKRSMHRDVSHLCNYIRSILDVAEHAHDKQHRNRFQQEALITLQRNRNDEVFSRSTDDFDFALYENIVHSRINTLDGKLIIAKKMLEETQIAIEQKFDGYPLKLAPDSIKVMNDIGDFEEAEKLTQVLKQHDGEIDSNVTYLLVSEEAQQADRKAAFKQHNQQGIEAYREGRFETALQSFKAAKMLTPVNIGVNLNLLQCIVKILEMQQTPEPALVIECREVYTLLIGIPLRENHQQKWNELLDDLTPFMET